MFVAEINPFYELTLSVTGGSTVLATMDECEQMRLTLWEKFGILVEASELWGSNYHTVGDLVRSKLEAGENAD